MVLFLIYVTASEFSRLFGPSEVRRLLFTRRPTELQLNRRQRMRELLRLSRLADFYTSDEFVTQPAPHTGSWSTVLGGLHGNLGGAMQNRRLTQANGIRYF